MTEVFWNQQATIPLLALLQLLPLAGAALLYRLRDHRHAVSLGQGIAATELMLAAVLYRSIDRKSAAMQFAERLDLPGPLDYHVGADGITVLFILLASLLTLLVTIYTPERKLPRGGLLLAVILTVEAVLMNMLATLNLFWFVAGSALELTLLGYLLWYWSTAPEKERALTRFYHFQAIGVLMLLAGVLLLGWSHADASGGRWSFDLLDLAEGKVSDSFSAIVFFLLFYGLAIRTPLFPMHGWLPVVSEHGNVATGPTFLLGVKVGIYGLVRFVFPTVPEAVTEWSGYAVAFATAGVFYSAFLAFVQTDLRRLLAFAVVSHTSLIIIGLFTLHHDALQGALLLAVTFGLAATAMLFMIGFVYSRTNTTRLSRLGGLFDRLPFIAIAILIADFAIIGMPGTPGFDAVHLVLESSMERFGARLTIAAALGNVVAAGFLLWAFQRAFLAPRPETETAHIEKAKPMELFIAFAVIAVLIGTGFYLDPWMDLIDAPLKALSARLGHG